VAAGAVPPVDRCGDTMLYARIGRKRGTCPLGVRTYAIRPYWRNNWLDFAAGVHVGRHALPSDGARGIPGDCIYHWSTYCEPPSGLGRLP